MAEEETGLTVAQMSAATGMLTALGGCEPQLDVHINAALNAGLTPQQIVEASCTPLSTAGSRAR